MSGAITAVGLPSRGLTLLELLVAAALSSLLVLGLVQVTSASSGANALQRNQSLLQERARFASNRLTSAVRGAGYRPLPWTDGQPVEALPPANENAVSPRSDRLAVRAWSDRNCFENRNPERDVEGRPRFYLRETIFDLTADGHLAHLCRYGPSAGELVTQVRREGLIPGVESFQLLFGEDADGNGQVERWVRAREWTDPAVILGVRAALLLAADEPVLEPVAAEWTVFDTTVRTPPDGRPRRLVEVAVALRGRLP